MAIQWGQVIDATRGRILVDGNPCASPKAFSIDTRSLAPGDCFFAIAGPNHDGHDYLEAAVAAGAAGLIVSRAEALPELPAGCTALLVEDTTRALQDLAAWLRRESGIVVVAITGSAGKTTTKELTSLLLSAERRTHASPGNLNNHYGLPLALLAMPEDTEVAVLEMGISTPGEMDRLIEIAQPDHGLVTLISPAHVGNFASYAELAEEKMKLPRGSRAALLNADDPEQISRRDGLPARVVEFGEAAAGEGALRLLGVENRGFEGSTLRLQREGRTVELECPLPGLHQARNLLAAATVALELGVSWDSVQARAALARPATHRGELRRVEAGGGTALVVDDSYNSNPQAMRAAIELLRSAPAGGRRLLVAGDMLELGERTAEEHRLLGMLAAEAGLDLLLGVGPEMQEAVTAARAAGLASEHLADAAAAGEWLASQLRDGDVVLVKGSRGIALDRTVARLADEGRGA
jgi:UDP-N-acetylmuramoyl-tripeptide--D-alanyl-D-alanine ligase